MRDYLSNKNDSDFLCRVLKKKYRSMGVNDVDVWSVPFPIGNTTNWAIRSDLTKKHPELFQF